MDKHQSHQSHQTTSSGSSSLRSVTGDRPPWDNAMEGMSLSRRSSGRSTTSSHPSRERPESVQIFGKTIFNRRGRSKRESSAQGPSGSPVHPDDPNGVLAATSKDVFMPGIFGRRKTLTRQEGEESDLRKKLQISGPYNFQHVTHTQRDEEPDQRMSRAVLPEEFTAMRASQMPHDPLMQGFGANGAHARGISGQPFPPVPDHSRMSMTRPPPLQTNTPRHVLMRTQSSDQMRVPPPRPARSPVETLFPLSGPTPPARMSSRISNRYDGFDAMGAAPFERPLTSGGFRTPQPFAFASEEQSPPSSSHGYSSSTDLDTIAENRYSRVISPVPDDANWPLTCSTTVSFETALADVPEEEEHHLARQSCTSLTSSSSLRASHSVPLMRQLAQAQEQDSHRPTSGASDTLGRFDLFAAQRALRAALEEEGGNETLPRASWEDDIDYAYDHEIEANCDYAWERPSLDMDRADEGVTEGAAAGPGGASLSILRAGHRDMPALSPSSQGSNATASEAITPTVHATRRASNFSLPRGDAPATQRILHTRNASYASSFKESHGFTLSPSLLIPNSDYHEQMRLHEADRIANAGQDYVIPEEPEMMMGTSVLTVQPRNSASTTGSHDSGRTGSERHVSTASTALTRLTSSTSSVDKDGLEEDKGEMPQQQAPTQAAVEPIAIENAASHARGKSEPMAALLLMADEMSTSLVEMRGDFGGAGMAGNESKHTKGKKSKDETAEKKKQQAGSGRDSAQARRQRARTTSLSSPASPVIGTYALFPSVK